MSGALSASTPSTRPTSPSSADTHSWKGFLTVMSESMYLHCQTIGLPGLSDRQRAVTSW